MSARAEMSTNAQSPQAEQSTSKGMLVALIGPNDAHRKIVARALASSQGRKVHEFIDYPGNLNDLPSMVQQGFDFVLVDVDTDESYALQIIEKLAEIGQPVMAYSARTDQELLMSCMRAGARDFLPLPTENAPPQESRPEENRPEQSRPAPPAAVPASKPAVATTPPVAARPVEPRPAPLPPVPAARSNLKPIVPQNRLDPGAETWFERAQEEQKPPAIAHKDPVIAQVIEEITIGSRSEGLRPETAVDEHAPSEFAAWDAANLRPAPPVPTPIKRAEPRPRPALVPERRKTEAQPRTVSSLDATPAPAIERPPVAVELFRSSQVHTEPEPDEAAEKQGAKWIKWILIAAGPMVIALVLLVVFTRPSASKAVATPVKEATPAPAPEINQANLIVNQPVKTSAKPIAGTPVVKPTDTPADATGSTASAPVSPDAMAQQLVAPTRIAGSIKKTAAADEPLAAPAPVSMDDNSEVPGSVFGSANKAKVTAHVVAISAGVADGMILRKTAPVYPKFAQEAHITGTVTLKATITKQGTIEGVQVLSGPKILAPAAVEAVKTWKYKPYMLDNQPVSVETDIKIVFGSSK